jgi:ornithine cyclodeaminase/alanine dehydrogenase-like protein (mu-crystallin family)
MRQRSPTDPPSRGEQVRYLTGADIEALRLSDADVLRWARGALVERAWGRSARTGTAARDLRDDLARMPGLLLLDDPRTGRPAALMEADWIARRRRAAVSAVACEHFAHRGARALGIVGAGPDGRAHASMLPLALPGLGEVRLFDVRHDLARAAAGDARCSTPGVRLRACSTLEEAARGADVLVSVTAGGAGSWPIVDNRWLSQGLLAISLDLGTVWEQRTITGADVLVADDVRHLPDWLPPSHAELARVVAGVSPGRQLDDQRIVVMQAGMKELDRSLGWLVHELAERRGAGRLVPLGGPLSPSRDERT